jgi:hypothetical protein
MLKTASALELKSKPSWGTLPCTSIELKFPIDCMDGNAVIKRMRSATTEPYIALILKSRLRKKRLIPIQVTTDVSSETPPMATTSRYGASTWPNAKRPHAKPSNGNIDLMCSSNRNIAGKKTIRLLRAHARGKKKSDSPKQRMSHGILPT